MRGDSLGIATLVIVSARQKSPFVASCPTITESNTDSRNNGIQAKGENPIMKNMKTSSEIQNIDKEETFQRSKA
ncbi:putative phosphoglucosamine mutase [Trichinella pseudospiralis]